MQIAAVAGRRTRGDEARGKGVYRGRERLTSNGPIESARCSGLARHLGSVRAGRSR